MNNIRIGQIYKVKIGKNPIEVRLDRTSPKGGWDGTVISTGKGIAIRNAKRLLGVVGGAQSHKKPATAPKSMSCTAAAIKVLGGSKEPLTCTQMIDTMQAKGYWTSPGGKTPANTLYSAILRELRKEKSRFKKAGRGTFQLQ